MGKGGKNRSETKEFVTQCATPMGEHGVIGRVFRAASSLDHRCSWVIFKHCQRAPTWRLLATVATLSADEAVAFPLTVSLGCWYLTVSSGIKGDMRELGRFLLRLYGDLGAVSLVESTLKCLFRRARPPWIAPSSFHAMLGDDFSFPSGHTMRAAYAAAVLASPCAPVLSLTTRGEGGLDGSAEPRLLPGALAVGWVMCVGFSRIGLGKHYAADVAAGMLVGYLAAASPYPTVHPQGGVRVCLAAAFTAQCVWIAVTPAVRAKMRGWPLLAGILVVFWATLPFAA